MLDLENIEVQNGKIVCKVNNNFMNGSGPAFVLYEGPLERALCNAFHKIFLISQHSIETAYRKFLSILDDVGHCGNDLAEIIMYFRDLIGADHVKPMLVGEILDKRTLPPKIKHLLCPGCKLRVQCLGLMEVINKPTVSNDTLLVDVMSTKVKLNRDDIIYYV